MTIFANAKEALGNASEQGMGSENDREMEQESAIMLMKARIINVSSEYESESEQADVNSHTDLHIYHFCVGCIK